MNDRTNRPISRARPANGQALAAHEIAQIEEALGQVQGNGEVCLVVKNGRLRFIEVVKDYVLAEEPNRVST
jgi:hypothetical protein